MYYIDIRVALLSFLLPHHLTNLRVQKESGDAETRFIKVW